MSYRLVDYNLNYPFSELQETLQKHLIALSKNLRNICTHENICFNQRESERSICYVVFVLMLGGGIITVLVFRHIVALTDYSAPRPCSTKFIVTPNKIPPSFLVLTNRSRLLKLFVQSKLVFPTDYYRIRQDTTVYKQA